MVEPVIRVEDWCCKNNQHFTDPTGERVFGSSFQAKKLKVLVTPNDSAVLLPLALKKVPAKTGRINHRETKVRSAFVQVHEQTTTRTNEEQLALNVKCNCLSCKHAQLPFLYCTKSTSIRFLETSLAFCFAVWIFFLRASKALLFFFVLFFEPQKCIVSQWSFLNVSRGTSHFNCFRRALKALLNRLPVYFFLSFTFSFLREKRMQNKKLYISKKNRCLTLISHQCTLIQISKSNPTRAWPGRCRGPACWAASRSGSRNACQTWEIRSRPLRRKLKSGLLASYRLPTWSERSCVPRFFVTKCKSPADLLVGQCLNIFGHKKITIFPTKWTSYFEKNAMVAVGIVMNWNLFMELKRNDSGSLRHAPLYSPA